MSVDLGYGADRLTLAGTGNTGTVRNVETIVAGAGSDTIGLATGGGVSADLGGGNDMLLLSNAGNGATVANVETVIGGNAPDAVVLTTAALNGSIDLGSGADTLATWFSGMCAP